MLAVIRRCEEKHKGKIIVLVSHGDPCQIVQAATSKSDLRTHREVFGIETGELRRLEVKTLKVDSA